MHDIVLYYFEFAAVPIVWLSVAVFNGIVFVKLNEGISSSDPSMMFGYTVMWPVFMPGILIMLFMIFFSCLFVHLWDAKDD